MLGFGNAVAVGDGQIFVGEPGNNMLPGIVYIYQAGANGMWTEAAQLTASDGEAGDRFGSAISVSGDLMAIGSTQPDSSRGAAFVFQKSGSGEWVEVARLNVDGAQANDGFGSSVAISGEMVLVGSADANENTGAVFAFHRDDSGKWVPAGSLVGTEVAAGDRFGSALGLDGNRALIGAPRQDGNKGVVYAFGYNAETMAWDEIGKLQGGNIEKNNRFGESIAMSGEWAIVGAPRYNRFIGSVYTFQFDAEAGEWNERLQLVPFDGSRQNRFGTSLAFDGESAWIGAPGANGFQGVVYLFQRDTESGTWTGASKLTAGDLQRGDFFSGTVAAGNGLAVVGIPGDDYGAGTALVFEAEAGHWASAGKIMSEAQGLEALVGGDVGCEDGTATMFDCEAVDMAAFLPVGAIGGGRGVRVNDVWGWTDPDTGREYALVGRVEGTAFVDITDPYNPVYLGDLPLTEGASINIWRDMKVYKNHVYIVADGAGEHGVQIFDLTQLRDVQNPPRAVRGDGALRQDRQRPQHRDQRGNRFCLLGREQLRR